MSGPSRKTTEPEESDVRTCYGFTPDEPVTPDQPEGPTAGRSHRSRSGSDEAYVINLADEALGEIALRQHRFEWLRGDPGRSGRTVALPVDAYYPNRRIVLEYRERQHIERVAIMDDRMTVSNVPRGVQRQIYDRRREELIPRHGLRLVIVNARQLHCDNRGRLMRNDVHGDRKAVRALLGLDGI